MSRKVRTTIAGAALAFLLLLPACGGDDGGEANEANLFDPARADAVSHAALLTTQDLPGTGWTVAGEDTFDDDNQPPADTAACRTIAAKRAATRENSDPDRSGRAQREFAAERGEVFPITVDVQVNIFVSTEAPKATLAAGKSYFGGNDFQQCFEDLLTTSVGTGVDVRSDPATASSPVPEDGIATAIDVVIRAASEEATLRLETYVWRSANAGMTLTITGPRELITKELTGPLLAKVRERLKAQESK